MDNLFKEKAQKIRIYLAVETVVDPFEKNVTLSELNPLPIKAIVTDLTPTQMKWKSAGIVEEGGKEIIIEKKYESLLKQSQKIEINNSYYYGWRTNGRLNYRIEGNYLRAYLYTKTES
ncbi:unnamed protein product [marine sediment metagenome]|uniref:Uncharacterized protein n=1 Tax=marine sediment metagenome TaxID=412755 RepID=X1J3M3_9ZZZZ